MATAGAIVALVTGLLSDRLSRAQEDEHLRDAVGTLAFELRAPDADPVWIAGDETRELAHTGMRVAVFEGDRFLAGDAALRFVRPGSCADQPPLRVCALDGRRWVGVIGRDVSALREHLDTTVSAAVIAVLLTSLLGALASFAVAKVVMKPLARLREAVHRVPEHDPSAADLGAHEDVAEVDALRASLRSALLRLGAALDQSRRFASDAAHQLRTPLTAILGELDLATEHATAGSDEITRARRVARRLATLVDRLLILARAPRSKAAHHHVDLLEVIEDAIDNLPTTQRSRVHYTATSVWVVGDDALLVAMLENALENALKFSPGDVRVSLEDQGDHAVLAVEDNGPGIASAEQEKVFAPFYRARDVAPTVSGHGLGLALIAHVAELHGGSARFADRSQGTRLEMRIAKRSEGDRLDDRREA